MIILYYYCSPRQQHESYLVQLPPHFSGSKWKASNARFWHKDSAMSMYLNKYKYSKYILHKTPIKQRVMLYKQVAL